MAVWARCLDCGKAIQRSDYSAEDAERDYHECPECQCKNPVDLTLAELIDNLTERVTELESLSCYETNRKQEDESLPSDTAIVCLPNSQATELVSNFSMKAAKVAAVHAKAVAACRDAVTDAEVATYEAKAVLCRMHAKLYSAAKTQVDYDAADAAYETGIAAVKEASKAVEQQEDES